MAKRRPTQTVVEMEEEMGFQLSHLSETLSSATVSSETPTGRLFSNLRPVSGDLGERTKKEHEEFVRRRNRVKESNSITLKQRHSETLAFNDDSVALGHHQGPGSYRFPLDVHYGFGLNLAFLFSESEASHLLSTAKLHKLNVTTQNSSPAAAFLSLLPLEIRLTIYNFALPRGILRMVNDEDYERDNFPRGIGDPSGFYYPLSKDLSVLRLNKQIRREALPFAYRCTTICLDNLDSAIKLLIAVSQIGRENIETLRLAWESTSEPAINWGTSPDQTPERLPGRLPSRSASVCTQLLKQCKRLRNLSLQFDSDLIDEIRPDTFRADAGIQGLCTLHRLKRVEIQEWGVDALEHPSLTNWLKEQMGGVLEEEE